MSNIRNVLVGCLELLNVNILFVHWSFGPDSNILETAQAIFANSFNVIIVIWWKTSNTSLRILSVKGGVGRGTPQIRNSFFVENFVRKRGRGVPPKSVTYLLTKKQVFFGQKTQFLTLFEDFLWGEVCKGEEGGPPQILNFFSAKVLSVGQNPQSSI